MAREPWPKNPRPRDSFGARYAHLWLRLRQLEWLTYAQDERPDRLAVDAQLFGAASRTPESAGSDADADLAERVRRRVLVDHHPEVARLRTRLDDWSSYGPVPGRPSKAWRRRLAAAMEPDVIALIRLRHELARALGAPSYGHLAMAAEGLDLEGVAGAMRQIREAGLAGARELARDEGATIETWFEALDRQAGPAAVDARRAAQLLVARLGCGDLVRRLRWEMRDGPLAGWTAAVRIPDDVRILVRPSRSLRDVVTVFHELGHALAYSATRAVGLRAIPSDTQDEAMGAVAEELGVRLVLPPDVRARLDRVRAAEAVRTATSALFEIAVQEEPQGGRELFTEWYGPLVEVGDPVIWAADSFRSADPFRIHAYALGAPYAAALADWLEERFGDEPEAWGRWLREALWAPGRRDSFAGLLRPLGGHVPAELTGLLGKPSER